MGSLMPAAHNISQTQSALRGTSRFQRALVFDSGVGGLSVVGEIRQLLPNLALDYVADDAFRPYGEKSVEALSSRLPGLIASLKIMLEPDCIVIACNTASVTALASIRAAVNVPVIGVVPAIKPAATLSQTKTIGVLGTPGTVRRKYVDTLIDEFASDCRVILQGSVNLVEFAERKLAGETLSMREMRQEIAPMFSGRNGADIDAVVLACTHFPLLRDELQQAVRQSVKWVDSGAAIAKRVSVVLKDCVPPERIDRADMAFLIGPETTSKRVPATAKNLSDLAKILAAKKTPKFTGTAPLIIVITLYGKGVSPAPKTQRAPLALMLSRNFSIYSVLPRASSIGCAMVSKNIMPIIYPNIPPRTEKKAATPAIFHHFCGAACTMGITITSTGMGKKELSAKDTTAKAGIARLCRASAFVFSYQRSKNAK